MLIFFLISRMLTCLGGLIYYIYLLDLISIYIHHLCKAFYTISQSLNDTSFKTYNFIPITSNVIHIMIFEHLIV